jgi:hypothetical protein
MLSEPRKESPQVQKELADSGLWLWRMKRIESIMIVGNKRLYGTLFGDNFGWLCCFFG